MARRHTGKCDGGFGNRETLEYRGYEYREKGAREQRRKEREGWCRLSSTESTAQAEEGWADGNCCFISDSANLARPPLCLLPNYERERIRLNEREKEGRK